MSNESRYVLYKDCPYDVVIAVNGYEWRNPAMTLEVAEVIKSHIHESYPCALVTIEKIG